MPRRLVFHLYFFRSSRSSRHSTGFPGFTCAFLPNFHCRLVSARRLRTRWRSPAAVHTGDSSLNNTSTVHLLSFIQCAADFHFSQATHSLLALPPSPIFFPCLKKNHIQLGETGRLNFPFQPNESVLVLIVCGVSSEAVDLSVVNRWAFAGERFVHANPSGTHQVFLCPSLRLSIFFCLT